MTPEQQAIVKALLMQGGQMTPMQQYQNAIDNSAGGMHPARKRFMAGNPVAKEPFNPLEALSAPQAMEQALLGSESRAPATSPRPQPSPMRGMPAPNPNDDVALQQTMWSRMSPEQQAQVMAYVQQGAPIDQALDAVADMDRSPYNMNAAARGQ